MALIQFMASPIGRGARIVLGVVLMIVGFGVLGGSGGAILGIVGIVPVAMGAFDVCLLAPLFGCGLRGAPKA